MTVTVRPITDRNEWLAWRRKVVTASVVGALPAFQCHPYCTPLRLFAQLRGVEFPDDDDNPVLRRGRWLEPSVAKAVSEMRPEWRLDAPGTFLVDESIGLGATPDFFICGDPRGPGILQAKTVAPSVYAREWDDGKDIPFWIVLQCLTEMMLSNAAFGAVAALLVDPHRMDVAILDVPRHPAAEAKIRTEVERFMAETAAGKEPEPDFERDGTVLRMMIPREIKGTTIDLSGDNALPSMLARRAELRYEIKESEAECEAIENRLRFLMGDAAIVEGLPGWRITYKTQHRVAYTVPAKDMRILRILDKRPVEDRPGGDNDNEE